MGGHGGTLERLSNAAQELQQVKGINKVGLQMVTYKPPFGVPEKAVGPLVVHICEAQA